MLPGGPCPLPTPTGAPCSPPTPSSVPCSLTTLPRTTPRHLAPPTRCPRHSALFHTAWRPPLAAHATSHHTTPPGPPYSLPAPPCALPPPLAPPPARCHTARCPLFTTNAPAHCPCYLAPHHTTRR